MEELFLTLIDKLFMLSSMFVVLYISVTARLQNTVLYHFSLLWCDVDGERIFSLMKQVHLVHYYDLAVNVCPVVIT